MKQWQTLVTINHNFRKSVNLQLDMGDRERLLSYIPTKSSVMILKKYLKSLAETRTFRATILIGPYGKGKSHLLLVLLALLHGELPEDIWKKIVAIDSGMEELVEDGIGKQNKYLPVLVSAIPGGDLNQTFIFALQEALKREGLEKIAPETYFSKAMEMIENWKEHYPDVYEKLGSALEKSAGQSINEFTKKLKSQDKEAIESFEDLYPTLTAGSVFLPYAQTTAMKVYQQVNRILVEQYGYAGMFLVFDEFSKYLEGHPAEGFAANMKTLQDMCELANNAENALHLTLVAHKSIHEYSRGIERSVKDSFRGVEGRIEEIEFVVSAQNNYELIADTIEKIEPAFSENYKEIKAQKEFQDLLEQTYALPCFAQLFSFTDFEETIVKGGFPMLPLTAYTLLHISEKVAQNERTIFTFLADEGQGSLSWLLQREKDGFIGVDKIYDYFKGLFRETADEPQIHGEWLKAEYALSRVSDEIEKRIVKAVAIIRMLHREDEVPAKDMILRLALGLEAEVYEKAVKTLKEKDILVYRSSIGVYAFRNNVGVDVENEIEKKMAELAPHLSLCDSLRKISEWDYELPKQYNQKYAMTRYFQYEYMTPEELLAMNRTEYLFEEKFADGKIVLLVSKEPVDIEKIQQYLDAQNDERLVVLVSEHPFSLESLLLKFEAVKALENNEAFIEENVVLLQELFLCEEDITFEVNGQLEEDYAPENGNVIVLRGNCPKTLSKSFGANEFNRSLSEICEQYYKYSPKVNHELLNIENVGKQYAKARDGVVQRILEGDDCEVYMTGTTPEAMVYRAAFVHTKEDVGCQKISHEIDNFFESCAGEKKKFQALYKRLQGKNYGTRRGVIPLFLAKKIAGIEGTAVIYIGNHELETSAETLRHVNEHPDKYEIYIEAETAEKDKYLKRLEEIFGSQTSLVTTKRNRLIQITEAMQKWYRSLSQYAMITRDFEEAKLNYIVTLRNLLKRAEINPRELLFDKFLSAFETDSYVEVIEILMMCKAQLERKTDQMASQIATNIRREFGASENESLKGCLQGWYLAQSDAAKKNVLTSKVHLFMNYLSDLNTNDELDIVKRLSRIVTDVFLEDWNDETVEQFQSELHQIRLEVEKILDQDVAESGKSRIILKDSSGNELEKCYEADTSDSTSLYLKNMIEEALEEFGDTLEMNQKVAVLVQTIEGLLQ